MGKGGVSSRWQELPPFELPPAPPPRIEGITVTEHHGDGAVAHFEALLRQAAKQEKPMMFEPLVDNPPALEQRIELDAIYVRADGGPWYLAAQHASEVSNLTLLRNGPIGCVRFERGGHLKEVLLTILGPVIRVGQERPRMRGAYLG
jgi:hypothetical protein